MKVIILAAGYGTRLQKDVENDLKQEYKHLLGVPKPLVPVGGKCLISRWMTNISASQTDCEIGKVYVVTNHHFAENFSTWARQWPDVEVLDDGTLTNETRLGAVADIQLSLEKFQTDDDVLIIGGDTLFYKDFDLKSFLKEFHARSLSSLGGALVTCYRCKDSDTKRAGILELDTENKIITFLEKPDPTLTSSRWAKGTLWKKHDVLVKKSDENRCPCFYVLSRKASQLISEFLKDKTNAPLKEKDAPGHFIKYLQKKVPVYAVPLTSGRFDIGNLESYIECDKYYTAGKGPGAGRSLAPTSESL